jgi:urease accessory protein
MIAAVCQHSEDSMPLPRNLALPPAMALLAAVVALLPGLAAAHTGAGTAAGFVTGFLHPVFGPDHVVAMVAVGLWGAQLSAPAIWLLPIAFPLMMAIGGMLGVLGVPVPSVEIGIALSGIVLGLMVAFAVRPPLWVALVLVGAFAIFHGHAHGTELPSATDPFAYGIGFVVATGLLHLAGILLGLAVAKPLGERAVRAAGAVIALAGGWFLAGTLGLAA